MNENEIQALIKRSETLGEQGKHQEAVEMLTNGLGQQYSDRLYFERGWHYFLLDHPLTAIEDFTSAIDINPTNARYFYWRGSVYWDDFERSEFGEDDFLNGLPDLMTCVRLDPTKASAYIKIALCLLDLLLPKDALYFADVACELEPDSDDAHNLRGMCLRTLHRIEEAIEEFKLVLDLSPGRGSAHSSLGRCYDSLGDNDSLIKASDCFRKAIESNTHSNLSDFHFYEFGNSLLKLRRYEEAIEVMQRLLNSNPEEGTRILAEHTLRKAEEGLS